MSGNYQDRNLIQFQRDFSNNESCAKHLAEQRWATGFTCRACGNCEFWFVASRNLLVCRQCRFQTSVTAGTIFHKTRISLLKWYWLLYRMAMGKVGVSICEIQRDLGIGQYRTAWLMAHKVRKAMAERDSRYGLAGLVEIDNTFFGPSGTKRGRGGERKCIVLCAVSLYRNNKGEEKPGFAHMCIVNNSSAQTIEVFLDRLRVGNQTEDGKQLLDAVRSDGWQSYNRAIKDKTITHFRAILKDLEAADKLLPWIGKIVTNIKDVIGGTHRGVSEKHLPSYLNEITYRFNRRYWDRELFDHLVQAGITAEPITYKKLVHLEENLEQ